MGVAMIPTKISRRHLDRVALVYVRQSTLAQVREQQPELTDRLDKLARAVPTQADTDAAPQAVLGAREPDVRDDARQPAADKIAAGVDSRAGNPGPVLVDVPRALPVTEGDRSAGEQDKQGSAGNKASARETSSWPLHGRRSY